MNGTINVFKPIGMTSHQVVSFIRKKFKTKKVGHGGTLDPDVSGVLVIAIGKGTKISQYLLDLDKEYIGELTLGIETDTQDRGGKVLNYSNNIVNQVDIEKTFQNYTGWIEQIPPMYSALRHNGKRLYELAREGKTVEREPRKVYIEFLDIINIENNEKILFKTKCSKGTYIRTLCDDIGKSLNTYGYMSYLMRTEVESFHISHSYSLDYINSLEDSQLNSIIKPIGESLEFMDSLCIDNKYYNSIINGAKISISGDFYKKYGINTIYKIYCRNTFIGLGRIMDNDGNFFIKMDRVLV